MDTKIQFQKNATILAANGEQVGSLNRVVVDPNTKVLTDIVVHTGALFNQEDRVVPIDLVAETTADLIVLREDAGDLKTFPPFEERHLVDTEGDIEKPLFSGDEAPQLYGFPAGVFLTPTPAEKYSTIIEQNIPQGTVALKEGAKVISADGKDLGSVERVFTSMSDEQITYLLISQGKIKRKTKLVPIEWVDNMSEEEVRLLVNKISVDYLDDIPVPEE
jgi:uncharacterized protein YrrD